MTRMPKAPKTPKPPKPEKRPKRAIRKAAARAKREKRATPDTTRYCDVVMKGGITSGVAYPLAMCELAEVYRFKNIGGTSTGAIAAAVTAAAEYDRGQRGASFDLLQALPQWFGQRPDGQRRSNLFSLFQPDPATRPLFGLFSAALHGRRNRIGRLWNLGVAALINYPLHALAGAIPGLALAFFAVVFGQSAVLTGVSMLFALCLILAGAALGLLRGVTHDIFVTLPRNNYGVCSGYAPATREGGRSLMHWIADTIDEIAGRVPTRDDPLTFGDLMATDMGEETGVNLRMMTTNLTQGRPMRVPFEDPGSKGIGQYYFDPDEFRRLFPPHLVDWLIAHAPRSDITKRHEPLLPLPRAADLPVAVGVRLSLSYPLLMSAVPLYTIDWTRGLPVEAQRPERCWFSDGGVTSNFPVHFFDQPLPRWPTFAINLRPPHIDLPDQEVWMPRSNRERGTAIWYRFDADGRMSLTRFIGVIKEVGQNWMDNEQARVPGYRDRIVHITLKDKEGGINLDMPGHVVESLADRGRRAGKMLVERFVTGPKWDVDLTWENHRWVRLRSTMHVVEEMLKHLQSGYRYNRPGETSYADMMARPARDTSLPYPWWNEGQRKHAFETIERLVAIVESWREPEQTFDRAAPEDPGPPEPYPILRIVPRV
jgi:predicted acylesterase/phospholipase RssA